MPALVSLKDVKKTGASVWNWRRGKTVKVKVKSEERKFNYWEKNMPDDAKTGFKKISEPELYSIFNCYDDVEETDPQILHSLNLRERVLENLSLVESVEMSDSQVWKD